MLSASASTKCFSGTFLSKNAQFLRPLNYRFMWTALEKHIFYIYLCQSAESYIQRTKRRRKSERTGIRVEKLSAFYHRQDADTFRCQHSTVNTVSCVYTGHLIEI